MDDLDRKGGLEPTTAKNEQFLDHDSSSQVSQSVDLQYDSQSTKESIGRSSGRRSQSAPMTQQSSSSSSSNSRRTIKKASQSLETRYEESTTKSEQFLDHNFSSQGSQSVNSLCGSLYKDQKSVADKDSDIKHMNSSAKHTKKLCLSGNSKLYSQNSTENEVSHTHRYKNVHFILI